MVDFQSRDTRRDLGDDEDDTEDGDEERDEETPEAEEEPTQSAETVEFDADTEGVTYAVVTVATDQSLDGDEAGDGVVAAIEEAGDAVVTREHLSPSFDGVQQSLNSIVDRTDVDCVVTVGGTGVEPDDVTVDAATAIFDRRLPGFGELFRIHSHDHEGSAVIRTRATAGIVERVPVFCLPGDPAAARRGVEQIVVSEAPELAADTQEDTDE